MSTKQPISINSEIVKVPGVGKMLFGQAKAKVFDILENIIADICKSGTTPHAWTTIQEKLNDPVLQRYVASMVQLEQQREIKQYAEKQSLNSAA